MDFESNNYRTNGTLMLPNSGATSERDYSPTPNQRQKQLNSDIEVHLNEDGEVVINKPSAPTILSLGSLDDQYSSSNSTGKDFSRGRPRNGAPQQSTDQRSQLLPPLRLHVHKKQNQNSPFYYQPQQRAKIAIQNKSEWGKIIRFNALSSKQRIQNQSLAKSIPQRYGVLSYSPSLTKVRAQLGNQIGIPYSYAATDLPTPQSSMKRLLNDDLQQTEEPDFHLSPQLKRQYKEGFSQSFKIRRHEQRQKQKSSYAQQTLKASPLASPKPQFIGGFEARGKQTQLGKKTDYLNAMIVPREGTKTKLEVQEEQAALVNRWAQSIDFSRRICLADSNGVPIGQPITIPATLKLNSIDSPKLVHRLDDNKTAPVAPSPFDSRLLPSKDMQGPFHRAELEMIMAHPHPSRQQTFQKQPQTPEVQKIKLFRSPQSSIKYLSRLSDRTPELQDCPSISPTHSQPPKNSRSKLQRLHKIEDYVDRYQISMPRNRPKLPHIGIQRFENTQAQRI